MTDYRNWIVIECPVHGFVAEVELPKSLSWFIGWMEGVQEGHKLVDGCSAPLTMRGSSHDHRHRRIHKEACKKCPTAHFPPDPESQDIKDNWSRVRQRQALFLCAWRPTALCRGQCDELGFSDEDVAQ